MKLAWDLISLYLEAIEDCRQGNKGDKPEMNIEGTTPKGWHIGVVRFTLHHEKEGDRAKFQKF